MSESQRLSALNSTELLDSEAEERFDRLTRLASNSLSTDIALISFIDQNRQWFKSRHGLDVTETPRDQAFCDHAIKTPSEVMVVLDANKDDRFKDNPLVTGGPNIGFYAGAPLVTKDGHALGTLCVIDSAPRPNFSQNDAQILKDLASTVMTEIELARQSQVNDDLSLVNEELQHRMGNMYAHISALVSMLGRTNVDKDQLVRRIREKITSLSQTQSLLAARNYESVSMTQLAESALSPFMTSKGQHRLSIQNHDDFEVSARGAFIITLMLNELGTNAIKHGALKSSEGRVEFSWKKDTTVRLSWLETSQASRPEAIPDNVGFGMQILKKIIPLDLQGQADFKLHDDGLKYSVIADPNRICKIDA